MPKHLPLKQALTQINEFVKKVEFLALEFGSLAFGAIFLFAVAMGGSLLFQFDLPEKQPQLVFNDNAAAFVEVTDEYRDETQQFLSRLETYLGNSFAESLLSRLFRSEGNLSVAGFLPNIMNVELFDGDAELIALIVTAEDLAKLCIPDVPECVFDLQGFIDSLKTLKITQAESGDSLYLLFPGVTDLGVTDTAYLIVTQATGFSVADLLAGEFSSEDLANLLANVYFAPLVVTNTDQITTRERFVSDFTDTDDDLFEGISLFAYEQELARDQYDLLFTDLAIDFWSPSVFAPLLDTVERFCGVSSANVLCGRYPDAYFDRLRDLTAPDAFSVFVLDQELNVELFLDGLYQLDFVSDGARSLDGAIVGGNLADYFELLQQNPAAMFQGLDRTSAFDFVQNGISTMNQIGDVTGGRNLEDSSLYFLNLAQELEALRRQGIDEATIVLWGTDLSGDTRVRLYLIPVGLIEERTPEDGLPFVPVPADFVPIGIDFSEALLPAAGQADVDQGSGTVGDVTGIEADAVVPVGADADPEELVCTLQRQIDFSFFALDPDDFSSYRQYYFAYFDLLESFFRLDSVNGQQLCEYPPAKPRVVEPPTLPSAPDQASGGGSSVDPLFLPSNAGLGTGPGGTVDPEPDPDPILDQVLVPFSCYRGNRLYDTMIVSIVNDQGGSRDVTFTVEADIFGNPELEDNFTTGTADFWILLTSINTALTPLTEFPDPSNFGLLTQWIDGPTPNGPIQVELVGGVLSVTAADTIGPITMADGEERFLGLVADCGADTILGESGVLRITWSWGD